MVTSTPINAETASKNRLLAALPAATLERLLAHLTLTSNEVGQVVHDYNQPITTVYFPLSSVLSMLNEGEEGTSIEVATIGRDGMSGVTVVLDAPAMPTTFICQVPGDSLTIAADTLRSAAAADQGLLTVLHRYVIALLTIIAQGSACNRLHPVNERCARWLLMTHDRVDGDSFQLTQEFLAQMIGVRRASVSLAAAALQEAGLITYARGEITIRNRKGLEQAACQCYGIIQREYERLFE